VDKTYVIKDPKVAKLFADETRRSILGALRKEELSATDLAKRLGKNHSSIVHHLNALLVVGLIKVTKEEKVRNMVQPYYMAVAPSFHIAYSLSEALSQDPDYSAFQDEFFEKMLLGLGAYSYDIPEHLKGEVRSLLRTCYFQRKKAYEERLSQRTVHVEVARNASRTMAHILSHIQLMKDEDYMKSIKRLAEILQESKRSSDEPG